MRIHAVQTGQLSGNQTFFRGGGWSSLLRRRLDVEFPVFAFIIERPDGLIAIDTGLNSRVRIPRPLHRFIPVPRIDSAEEIGPRMRALGLDPRDVHTVVLTHLDWDHAGGLECFPAARVLVHAPEFAFAAGVGGRMRYQPKHWPAGFAPSTYELDDESFGPFPRSKVLTDDGELVLVPLPGHSVAQVGVVIQGSGPTVLLSADHFLRADWFSEDLAAGNEIALGVFFRDRAVETSRRIEALAQDRPLVLAPSHDSETPARLADPAASVWKGRS